MFGGAIGQTVHGMPQIGQLRKGLWVASGFGRQGLNTSAMAGQLIARSILWGDERWRLFSPFELVWAGGPTGRVAGYVVGLWGRGEFGRRRRACPLSRARADQGAFARRGWPRPTARPGPRPPPRRRATVRPAGCAAVRRSRRRRAIEAPADRGSEKQRPC